ncbi:MAG TPA: dTDP-glucose 4,6-dehydratase, partial [Acidimicrobiaceae bacterium]|nr:dTDP-glucose 4,6-dehydratase [Acidimicrobiaceae bacterium]
MRILVTGGAGFIGSHFVRRLLAGGDDRVTILDALTYAGGLDTIADLVADDRVDFVEGDVADAAAVRGALPGHDVVVNFAAESHVDRSLGAPASFATTNCTGTAVLCEAAVRLGVERFVQVSTDEVYGSVDVGSSDESAPLAPSSAYSASKAGADLLALAA